MRLVEFFVLLNAICGIAAFLIARGAWRWMQRKARALQGGDEQRRLGP